MRDVDKAKKVIRDILHLAMYVDITRHTRGKLRLKFSLSGIVAASEVDFDDLVRRIPGLLNAQIKLFSRSIVIDYDPGILPADLWEDLARVKRKPEMAAGVAERLLGVMTLKC